ncbi:uncharacterized protein BDV14DRAFT_201804 [Aspergillus stella-maris]|uniref:uncharacterized protein n=1 Tax=Aspergillus stella-maris TaxID=1810926 RepID=UPI003CCD807F
MAGKMKYFALRETCNDRAVNCSKPQFAFAWALNEAVKSQLFTNLDAGEVRAPPRASLESMVKFAFGGRPFKIEIYLGPADDSRRHFTPHEYVTNVYNFSTPGTANGQEVCSNCTDLQQCDVGLMAYVPIMPILNSLILEDRLASLKKDDVEAVLKRLYQQVTVAGRQVPENELTASNL